MALEPIIKEEFYAWVAPDGAIQLATLAAEPVMCLAYTRLLYEKRIGQSPHEMKLKGFKIQKVILTVEAAEDSEPEIRTQRVTDN